MKPFLSILVLLMLGASVHFGAAQDASPREIRTTGPGISNSDRKLARAFENKLSGFRIRLRSVVVRLLPLHTHGGTRQEFIVALASGQTLLIVHNLEIATRIPHLRLGDRLQISGVYRWNFEGGEIHDTNHDPAGMKPGGWIRRHGMRYQ